MASGFVFGLATLTKPQVLFLPGLLVLFGIFGCEEKGGLRERLVKGVAIYLVMAAILVPGQTEYSFRGAHSYLYEWRR